MFASQALQFLIDEFNELYGKGWGGVGGDCYGKCSRYIVVKS